MCGRRSGTGSCVSVRQTTNLVVHGFGRAFLCLSVQVLASPTETERATERSGRVRSTGHGVTAGMRLALLICTACVAPGARGFQTAAPVLLCSSRGVRGRRTRELLCSTESQFRYYEEWRRTGKQPQRLIPFDTARAAVQNIGLLSRAEWEAVLTRTSRSLRTVRTGYAYQPPMCCTTQRHRVAWHGGGTTVRTLCAYQPRAACRTYRVPCGTPQVGGVGHRQ